MTMSRAQFIALTTVLAAAVMAGAGYLAYAAVDHSSTPPQGLPPATGSSQAGSPVDVPTSSATTTATASASPSALPGVTASTTAPACGDGDITVSLGQGQGAAGHISVLLLFTNASAQACTLHGYPGAELSDPTGTLAPLDAVRKLTGPMGGAQGLSKPPVVTLAVGQTVSAVLEWTDVPAGNSLTASCYTSSDTFQATPPNSKRSTTLALGSSAMVCGAFQVHPVLPLIGNAPNS